ncbi:predicted protein [Streptomyces viridosporus ATCC 14672]|uniref:Predicted protein n=1 Tax=Streptomyces viridosporus (strain ATCC 14672 / DSM 40746 / JCM 4963 / KCTC 9882 / NRRL B-12104 / FH 1290) TaxID=566461 RepID=D6A1L0_STRV1|nr:predicted protein [Streptomyces viridosporus ATCC 14672]
MLEALPDLVGGGVVGAQFGAGQVERHGKVLQANGRVMLPPSPFARITPIGRGTHLCGVEGPTRRGMGPAARGKWGAGPMDRGRWGRTRWPRPPGPWGVAAALDGTVTDSRG